MTDTAVPTALNSINAALADLQTQLPRITKDLTAKVKSERTGAQYSYNYADLAQISAEVLPLLGKLGLSFTSRPTIEGGEFVLIYELRHISGEKIPGVFPLPDSKRATPQEIGSAITYARRYCLCAVTGVSPDDDNDGQVAEKAALRARRREERGSSQAPADNEPRITAQQQRDMQGLFQELDINDKAERLKFAATAAARELRSATELKQAEADRVIGTLKQAVAKKAAKVTDAKPADPEKDPEAWVASKEPPADHKGVPAR